MVWDANFCFYGLYHQDFLVFSKPLSFIWLQLPSCSLRLPSCPAITGHAMIEPTRTGYNLLLTIIALLLETNQIERFEKLMWQNNFLITTWQKIDIFWLILQKNWLVWLFKIKNLESKVCELFRVKITFYRKFGCQGLNMLHLAAS